MHRVTYQRLSQIRYSRIAVRGRSVRQSNSRQNPNSTRSWESLIGISRVRADAVGNLCGTVRGRPELTKPHYSAEVPWQYLL